MDLTSDTSVCLSAAMRVTFLDSSELIWDITALRIVALIWLENYNIKLASPADYKVKTCESEFLSIMIQGQQFKNPWRGVCASSFIYRFSHSTYFCYNMFCGDDNQSICVHGDVERDQEEEKMKHSLSHRGIPFMMSTKVSAFLNILSLIHSRNLSLPLSSPLLECRRQ